MPGSVIDVEAVVHEFVAIAIIHLGAQDIGHAYLPATQLRERQRQAALRLVAGVIDDNNSAGAVITGPDKGDKAVRGPVPKPSRLRLDLRPGTVAIRTRLQNPQ